MLSKNHVTQVIQKPDKLMTKKIREEFNNKYNLYTQKWTNRSIRNPIELDQACKIKMDTIKMLMNNTLK